MPIYEYRCAACSHVTAVLVRSLTAKVSPTCEACGSKKMSKVFSNVAAVRDGAADDPDKPKRPSFWPEGIDNAKDYSKFVERRIDAMGIPMPADAKKRLNAAREGKPMPDEGPAGAPPAP
jgi:putative FmdB family regulatory protein